MTFEWLMLGVVDGAGHTKRNFEGDAWPVNAMKPPRYTRNQRHDNFLHIGVANVYSPFGRIYEKICGWLSSEGFPG